MCREVWGFESLRGHQNRKGRLTKVSRPFVFWGPRARRLRALREGRESPALHGRTGSRDVAESLRGHQNRKGRVTKVSRPFVFWGPPARRLRALREGRESPALQGRTGSRDVTESLRGHQNKKGRLMKINRPFAFWGARAKRLRALREGGTRKSGLARPDGVAGRDRVPPWAPKQKRPVDENQPAFCVLGRTSKAPARLAGGRDEKVRPCKAGRGRGT